MDGTILVADDDRTIRTVLTQALTRAGCKVHATSSLETLKRWVAEGKGDLVISDVVMPDGNGLETLPIISEMRPGLPVIVISAQNTIMTAIEATERAAFDYLPKPFDLPDLMKRVGDALAMQSPLASQAGHSTSAPDDLPLIGRSQAMQELYQLVARARNADLPLMIAGESGTGKSLLARAIHDLSDRKALPFIVVAANELGRDEISDRRHALAQAGTLLLDEIGDLDAQGQARAVRLIDELGPNGPKIMSTCQGQLTDLLAKGDFREDLYYRLCGAIIPVPPLRERAMDIPLLAAHFLSMVEKSGAMPRDLDETAQETLRKYSWPGNVRQLENVMRQLAVFGADRKISAQEAGRVLSLQPGVEPVRDGADKLRDSVAQHVQRYFDLHGTVLPPPGLYGRILREVEAPLIEIALDATGGNQAKCADLLGINRNTLRKKITDLDIRVTRRRKLM